MKNSWIISSITSFVLLGGVLLSPAASADAAKVAASTYSDQSYSEDEEHFSEEFTDESEFSETEQKLTKDQEEFEKYLDQIATLVPYENKAIDTLEASAER